MSTLVPSNIHPLPFQKQRIQMAFLALVALSKFYKVELDANTREIKTLETTPYEIVPVSVVANDTNAAFDFQGQGGTYKVDMSAATWKLEIAFAGAEVICERFEDLMRDMSKTFIPRSATLPMCNLILSTAEYKHPPYGNPDVGTRVEYTFQVIPTKS